MMEVKVTKTTNPKVKPDPATVPFGVAFTDHMFMMDYDSENGWQNPRIVPFGDISLNPGALVFHYGAEVFEGLKAYRTPSGEVQMFRPAENFKRMNNSAERLCLPQFDVDDAVEYLRKFVEVEKDWVPDQYGTSLYLRPFLFGTDADLALHGISHATFMVIACVVGSYYKSGLAPVDMLIEMDDVRAVRGGTGYAKCGGNYAAATRAGEKAAKKGYSQVVWVDGVERKYVEEGGGMNLMFVWDGKLAAYLLDASASKYNLSELIISYRADAAFTCEKWPDAGALADLFAKMKAEITALDEDSLYNDIEFPLAQVLADMTRIGILVDKEGIEKFGVKMRSELEDVLTRIHMETGSASFNPNSPKQLGEMLFDTMGLPHGKKTQRGWSTDAETLEALRDYPLVEDILQYRAYQKLNSTYVEGLLKVIAEDGRIHTRFNQTEARTGRLSSDNPNLQNIPIRTELGSQLRAYFVARPGCVLVDADYSQIELRILAHVTGDEHMQQAFLTGEDIHRSTAAKIYGLPLEQVTPRLRSSAKAINFGIMYGKGAYSLSKDIGVSVKEADAFLKNYLATFPKVSGYMDKTISDARNCGYVSTLFGRRRSLPELASNNHNIRASGERMARNTPIQGTAADVIKLAMVRVWRRLRDEKMESRLILTVHDELIVEAPEAEAAKAAAILQEEMEGCVNYAVPLSTEVHQGKNWLEAH